MKQALGRKKVRKRAGVLLMAVVLAMGTMTASAAGTTTNAGTEDETVVLTLGLELDQAVDGDVSVTYEIQKGYELTEDDIESFANIFVDALDSSNNYKAAGLYDAETGKTVEAGYVVNEDVTLIVVLEVIQSTPTPTPKPEEDNPTTPPEDEGTSTPPEEEEPAPSTEGEKPVNPTPPATENENPIVTSPKMGEPTWDGLGVAILFAGVLAVGCLRTKRIVR